MPFARRLRRGSGNRTLALALFAGACSRAPLAATTVENAAGAHVHAHPAAPDLSARQKALDPALSALEAEAGTAVTLEPRRGLWNVTAMSWAPDARTLVVASGDVLHTFDTDGYRETSREHTGGDSIVSMAFSPDSRQLALGVGQGVVVLWDLGGERDVRRFDATVPEAIRTLTFSPDGSLLAGLSYEYPYLTVWNVASGRPLPGFESRPDQPPPCGYRGSSGPVGAWPAMLEFSPDGRRLVSTCSQNLAVWTLGSSRSAVPMKLMGAVDEFLYSTTYHPGGRHVLGGTYSGALVVWDLATGRRRAPLHAHPFDPLGRFSRDGKRLLTAAADGVVRSFAFANGTLRPLATHRVPDMFAEARAVHPDATTAAFAGDGALVVQDVTGELTQVIPRPLGVRALAVDARSMQLAFGADTGALGVLDVGRGSIRWLEGHTDRITALAFSPDAGSLASVARDAVARVWDLDRGEARLVLPHPAGLNGVAYRRDGRALVTAGDDGVVRVWDPATGEEARQLEASSCPIVTLRYSPGGSLLVANTTGNALLRWDALTYATPPAAAVPPTSPDCAVGAAPNTLDFSPGGRLVASAPTGGAVVVWNTATGERQDALGEPTFDFPVSSVALSSRDPIAVAAAWGKLRAWHLYERTPLPAFAPPGEADTITFSPDGRFLVGASRHGTVSVWRVTDHATRLTLALTLELADPDGALAKSPDGLIQWLGPSREHASCMLGSHLYPAELCAKRFEDPELIARVFSER